MNVIGEDMISHGWRFMAYRVEGVFGLFSGHFRGVWLPADEMCSMLYGQAIGTNLTGKGNLSMSSAKRAEVVGSELWVLSW